MFCGGEGGARSRETPGGHGAGLDTKHHRVPPAHTFPNGCHIVEVEIDPDTGVATIERYTVVDDFGRTINPTQRLRFTRPRLPRRKGG